MGRPENHSISSETVASDHEGEVELLDAAADVERAVDRRICSVEGSEAGPDAAPQHDTRQVDLIHLNGPALLGLLQSGIVQEVMAEDVLFARSLINFIFLLHRSQVHVRVERLELGALEATERLIRLHVAQGVLSPGADRHDLALAVNHVGDVAETLELGDAVGG